MRVKIVMEEIMRNLIACGNLLSVESDQEDQFWENDFRKTIIAPTPRARPISLFKQFRRKMRVYKNGPPFPSSGGKKNSKGKPKLRQAQPKLAERITELIDPPRFPIWLGDFFANFWLLIGSLMIAITPCLRVESGLICFTKFEIQSKINYATYF